MSNVEASQTMWGNFFSKFTTQLLFWLFSFSLEYIKAVKVILQLLTFCIWDWKNWWVNDTIFCYLPRRVFQLFSLSNISTCSCFFFCLQFFYLRFGQCLAQVFSQISFAFIYERQKLKSKRRLAVEEDKIMKKGNEMKLK